MFTFLLQEQVITSAYVAAQHLKNRSFKGKAYIVGMEGIAHELTDIGITHLPLEVSDVLRLLILLIS